jgi:hypothetical protein
LLSADFVGRTVWINDTFWSTIRRKASHAREARTVTAATIVSGRVAVGSTWVRFAGIINYRLYHRNWFESTCGEGISNISLDAGAGWNVVENFTDCIDSAGSRARINTLVSLTCFIRGTV